MLHSNERPLAHTYRRLLLDMHVPDWDARFLASYEPTRWIDAACDAGAGAVTVFANTHTGLANYPSAVGPQHSAFSGRDPFGEALALARGRGLLVTAYYCTTYVDWYWDTYPEARVVDANGVSVKVPLASPAHPRRFSVCCMNNPGYRAFAVAQLEEICGAYDFDALTLDMTFWGTVCYCDTCRARHTQELGSEPPTVIDWADPPWVAFQRRRQAWLLEFVRLLRGTVTRLRPGLPVSHQSIAYTADWLAGGSVALAAEADWLSADIYRDRDALSFYFNLFKHLSTRLPFEAISTWCYPNIREHVITRTPAELRVAAFRPLLHRGAIVFIDAVDPSGQVATETYRTVAPIYADLALQEPYAVGRPIEDVALYLSYEASIDLAENGRPVSVAGYLFESDAREESPSAHRQATLSAAQTLLAHHIPFAVITARDLPRLAEYQVVVLANVVVLGEDELAAFRAYVAAGGGLYASRLPGILDPDGRRRPDLGLADLLGGSYRGDVGELISYVAPTEAGAGLFGAFTAARPMTLPDGQTRVEAHPDAEVLATVTLPYTDPRGGRYASLLTDPPGIATDLPAVVRRRHGMGRTIYAAGTLEIGQHDSQRAVFAALVRALTTRPFAVETDAPKPVEIAIYDDREGRRLLLYLLNVQRELPNIPISGIPLRVRLDGRTPRTLVTLPERTAVTHQVEGAALTFEVPQLETFLALELAYS